MGPPDGRIIRLPSLGFHQPLALLGGHRAFGDVRGDLAPRALPARVRRMLESVPLRIAMIAMAPPIPNIISEPDARVNMVLSAEIGLTFSFGAKPVVFQTF